MTMPYEDLTTTLTPASIATDAITGETSIRVYAGTTESTTRPVVVFGTTEPDEEGGELESTFVVLPPAAARAFAAGILNAADEAEERVPLVFLPDCKAPCCEATPKVEP